jgi:alpha-L-fucosidase
MKRIALLALIASALVAPAEVPYTAKPESLQRWREWRLGMFIHWGPVSFTEKEISWSRANTNPQCPNYGPTPADEYDNLYKKFDPVKFDANEWVAIARAAGMKYMVLTVKHCDGFLLWDSKVSDYNIMNTPFRRDVASELAKACHDAGMGLGWYYSPMDWKDPDCRNEKNADFVKRMQAELTELLSNYGKIDVLWFDMDGRSRPWDQVNTYALVHRLQPDMLVSDRLGPPEPGDFSTPEQVVGGFDLQRPWESCMTVSRRGQWSWGGHGDGVKTFEECMNMLVRCAGGDGNMLLNVGPMPDGAIAPEQTDRIKEMGAWLAKYGECIYGTRGGPFKPGRYGVSTRKGNTIYLLIQDWPAMSGAEGPGDSLELPDIPAKVTGGTALTGGKVEVTQSDGMISVSLPASERAKPVTVIALQLDKPAMEIEPVDVRTLSHAISAGKPATASNVFQNQGTYAAGKAFDDDGETRWATDGGTKSAWLEVDLGKPADVRRAVIAQAYPELQRVKKFAVEYWQGDEWKTCYRGEDLGARLDATFAPVTAQRFRLNITEATDGPTIWEFQLFSSQR